MFLNQSQILKSTKTTQNNSSTNLRRMGRNIRLLKLDKFLNSCTLVRLVSVNKDTIVEMESFVFNI